jgi:hypothetical protein
MLTKIPRRADIPAHADANGGLRKRTPLRAAPAPAAAHEPKANWVPLWMAPFFCTSKGYIRSMEKWKDALYDEVQQIIEPQHPAPDPFCPLHSPPPWSFERGTRGNWWLSITAMGILTQLAPGSISVYPNRATVRDLDIHWPITGSSDEILKQPEWDKVSSDERLAAQWHRWLLERLFSSWHGNLVQAVRSGAAHIMARKNTVLAPFERITWEQWHLFRLDAEPQGALEDPAWCDPRDPYWSRHTGISTTASGPAGERLYAIYIAPGVPGTESGGREEAPDEPCCNLILVYSGLFWSQRCSSSGAPRQFALETR